MLRVVSPLVLAAFLVAGSSNSQLLAQGAAEKAVSPDTTLFQRAWKLEQGIGAPINMPEAIRLYRESAASGNALAKARLARIYFGGNGVVANTAEAERLSKGIFPKLLSAAEKNDAVSQLCVGTMYLDGLGVARDGAEGVKWLRKAADQNLPLAMGNLGVAYENGIGVERDLSEALKWYGDGAIRGCAMAQAYLANFYHSGRGVERNEFEAARLWRLAADQNFAFGQTNLGYMYEHGCGVEMNVSEAVRLYRLAAEQNFAVGQTNLGQMYEHGCGVRQNLNEAVWWYRKAAAQGDANAIECLRCLGYDQ
jgi:TPR repeat protein